MARVDPEFYNGKILYLLDGNFIIKPGLYGGHPVCTCCTFRGMGQIPIPSDSEEYLLDNR